ncbi:hypothetical protein LINPERPRIM_LOCUS23758, partial [Linum perenne]
LTNRLAATPSQQSAPPLSLRALIVSTQQHQLSTTQLLVLTVVDEGETVLKSLEVVVPEEVRENTKLSFESSAYISEA